jgi:hypothetical protein
MTDDLFGQPARGGKYIKFSELENGTLLLIKPSEVKMIPGRGNFNKGQPVETAIADVVIFGPEGYEEYEDQELNQGGLLKAAKSALKPGARPFILARWAKVPTKDTAEKLGLEYTAEAYATARTEWLKKGAPEGQEPKGAYQLQDFTDDDAQRAREYIASKQAASDPFANA